MGTNTWLPGVWKPGVWKPGVWKESGTVFGRALGRVGRSLGALRHIIFGR